MKAPNWLKHGTLALGLMAAVLVGESVGCANSATDVRDAEGEQRTYTKTVKLTSLNPNWDLEDMVERSDAIVIGTLTSELASKTSPDRTNTPPKFNYVFKDYKMTKEEAIYPTSGLPDSIAVLAETGIEATNANTRVISDAKIPDLRLASESCCSWRA